MLVRTGAVDPGVPLLSRATGAALSTPRRAARSRSRPRRARSASPWTGPRAGRSPARQKVRTADARSAGGITRCDAGLLCGDAGLAERLGVDLSAIGSNIDLVTPRAGALFFANTVTSLTAIPARAIERIAPQPYSSTPKNLITAAGIARHGYRATRGGWLIESASPLTAAQLTTARQRAAAAGLTIETRRNQDGLHTLRKEATVGACCSLAILAMTVGLIRSEAGRALRTRIATGATSATRRTVTASTAGALAFVGIILGIAAAYLALVAGYAHDLKELGNVPVLELAVTVIGVPLIAAAAGWLLAGREPPSLARRARSTPARLGTYVAWLRGETSDGDPRCRAGRLPGCRDAYEEAAGGPAIRGKTFAHVLTIDAGWRPACGCANRGPATVSDGSGRGRGARLAPHTRSARTRAAQGATWSASGESHRPVAEARRRPVRLPHRQA